ncbi:MAG TPA: beta-hydroxydecanoyl-ACP dehydratase [Anaerolineaceae bacterium]|nr:beta-hydroxydecanoyl-ACP dehydratase [Anaerolineaceae bacterium]
MDSSKETYERREKILERHRQILSENAQNASELHEKFLQFRQEGLGLTAKLIQEQAKAAGGAGVSQGSIAGEQAPVLYTHAQLEEFAKGDAVKCLGPAYEVYRGRRISRIPNGDLLLMSRVLRVNGERFQMKPGTEILVEYDVSQKPWFLQDNSYPYAPYSILMEIALQPCGFLSAHLGAPLMFPDQDYYFRNLDGEARLIKNVDLRGKTVTTRAVLQKTMVSGKQIIQGFSFQLSAGGEAFFEGNSVFGFFPPEAMANQLGRDGGQETLPLYEQPGQGDVTGVAIDLASSSLTIAKNGKPFYRLPDGHFNLLKEVVVSPSGGKNRHGYIYANKPVDGRDWFYTCHFFQDPVMPGSLGVEAILEAMQVFALQMDLGKSFQSPRFDLVPGNKMSWKYRGQILQTHKKMKLEIHLASLERTGEQALLIGDASLWADKIRIYEVKDAAIRLVEG